jgi:ubiquinone biosynthesis protein
MADGRVGFVDFGRVSTISDRDRERAMELVSALMDSDEVRATEVLIETTRADPSIDRAALQLEVADLIDAFTSKGAKAIGLDGVFERMFGMIRRYGLQMPDSLAMLFITMGTLEGVASTLDPDFDFVTSAKPMVERLLPQRWGRQRLERAARRSGFRYFRLVEDFPFLADLVLRRAGSGEFKVAIRPIETDPVVDRLEGLVDKLAWSVILAALILGTAILLTGSERIPEEVLVLLDVVALVAIVTVAWMVISVFRRGRRRRGGR